eukprot:snap_masked-scaffold_15-processed-gene-7.1-mRNA-1 protein AED:1.00 eAED:1.00 QI:0/-1/0/0/-1/1/1/0/294
MGGHLSSSVQYHKDEIIYPAFIHSEFTLLKLRKFLLWSSVFCLALELALFINLELDLDLGMEYLVSLPFYAALFQIFLLVCAVKSSSKILDMENNLQEKHKTLNPHDFQLNVETLHDIDRIDQTLTKTEILTLRLFTISSSLSLLALGYEIFALFFSDIADLDDTELTRFGSFGVQVILFVGSMVTLFTSTLKISLHDIPLLYLVVAIFLGLNIVVAEKLDENHLAGFEFLDIPENATSVDFDSIDILAFDVQLGVAAGAVLVSFLMAHLLVVIRSSLYYKCRKPLMRLLSNAS